MKRYSVVVKCPKQKYKSVKRTLGRYGLKWTGGSEFRGFVSAKTFDDLSVYCRKKRLQYRTDNAYGTRSNDYRQSFFKNNPPAIGKLYFCAYCGRLKPRRYITVDHLYPIAKAGQSIQLQKKLRRMGIKNINSPRNLVAACPRCNGRKGKKMGGWILKGKIGRYPEIWIVRHTIRVMVLSLIIYQIFSVYGEEIAEIIQQIAMRL